MRVEEGTKTAGKAKANGVWQNVEYGAGHRNQGKAKSGPEGANAHANEGRS